MARPEDRCWICRGAIGKSPSIKLPFMPPGYGATFTHECHAACAREHINAQNAPAEKLPSGWPP